MGRVSKFLFRGALILALFSEGYIRLSLHNESTFHRRIPATVRWEAKLNENIFYREWKKYRREMTYTEPIEIREGQEDYFFQVLKIDVPYRMYDAHGEAFRKAVIRGFGRLPTQRSVDRLVDILTRDSAILEDKSEATTAIRNITGKNPELIKPYHLDAIASLLYIEILNDDVPFDFSNAPIKNASLISLLGEYKHMPALGLLLDISYKDYEIYSEAALNALSLMPSRRATYRLLERAEEEYRGGYFNVVRVLKSAKLTGMWDYASERIIAMVLDVRGKCEDRAEVVPYVLTYASPRGRRQLLSFDEYCPDDFWAGVHPYSCHCAVRGKINFWRKHPNMF